MHVRYISGTESLYEGSGRQLHVNCLFFAYLLYRARAQCLVQSLSLLMVDASLGTIQCLEEIVSTSPTLYQILSKLLSLCSTHCEGVDSLLLPPCGWAWHSTLLDMSCQRLLHICGDLPLPPWPSGQITLKSLFFRGSP